MERRMKKLLTVYNEIINDENTSLPNIFDINDINEIQPKFKWFNIYQIINEYVEDNELTPIPKIVGESTFKRSKIIPGNGYGFYQKHKDFFDKIFNKQISNNLFEFIHYIIRNKEQDTSIKHILMNFQRYYEFKNKERSCYKTDIETKNINLKQRLTWLNNIFSQLNNTDYFLSETWKNNINLIKNDFESLNDGNKMHRNFIYAVIGFLIYEELLPERNVKNKLINHFKTFKFRDN
jgi:hypothetical protein